MKGVFNMYTACLIRWEDSPKEEFEVIIKANDEIDERDDDIFFYGLSRQQLLDLCDTGELVNDEWRVIKVYETRDSI